MTIETPEFQGTHLWERLHWAKEKLEPIQSDYRVVWEDPNEPDEPAKVTIPKDKGYDQTYHTKAYKTKPLSDQDNTIFIPADDAKLYTDVFSVKVTPNMAQPQKIYKKLGGFINKNLFRMN